MPAAPDHREHGTEKPGKESPACQKKIQVLLNVSSPSAYAHECLVDRPKHNQVGDGDAKQERSGNECADDSADVAECFKPMLEEERRCGNCRRANHNNRRVAQRKEKSNGDRPFAFLHQFAGHVVDGRNVIGVHGMAQAKTVREEGGSKKQRIVPKRQNGPGPGANIEHQQQTVDAGDLPFDVDCGIVKQAAHEMLRRRLWRALLDEGLGNSSKEQRCDFYHITFPGNVIRMTDKRDG